MKLGYVTASLLVLGLVVINVEVSQARYLPQFVCISLRDSFIRRGCIDSSSIRCRSLYRFMTNEVLGNPACDFVTCTNYGNAFGTCTAPTSCRAQRENALCNNGQICCTSIITNPGPSFPGDGQSPDGGTNGGDGGGEASGGASGAGGGSGVVGGGGGGGADGNGGTGGTGGGSGGSGAGGDSK